MARRPQPANSQRGLGQRLTTGIADPRAPDTPGVTDNNTRFVGTVAERLLTVREAADFLRLSTSWLAKARMRGDGPPFVKLGGSIRYLESTLVRWMKAQQRLSISDR